MKILKLSFQNLNSLYGEWEIDFTTDAYVESGIFVLTGVTGSGKTTILDAICLALYGATPRLGRITQASNEIMSRQTASCYAEVLFTTQGKAYICHWSQKKTKTGNLAESRHEITDLATSNIIESKKSKTPLVVAEKIGMDFDQFTRSVLLAQGSFDSFLKADDEAKSKILEQITGTQIYTNISRKVHERQREEQIKLDSIKKELDTIRILLPEQVKELKAIFEEKQKEQNELTKKQEANQKVLDWYTNIATLKQELEAIELEGKQNKQAIDAFKIEENKLEASKKAAELEGDYQQLTSIRNEVIKDKENLLTQEAVKKQEETDIEKNAIQLKEATDKAKAAIVEQKQKIPRIVEARSIDKELQGLKDKTKAIQEAYTKQEATQNITKQKHKDLQEAYKAKKKELATVEAYLQTNAQDKELTRTFTGIKKDLETFAVLQKQINGTKEEQKKEEQKQKQWQEERLLLESKVKNKEQEESKLQLVYEEKEKQLASLLQGKLIREYRTQKEHLLSNKGFLQNIANLKEERDKLKQNHPCPLCGSIEHPYVKVEAIPSLDKTEQEIQAITTLITKAEEIEKTIEESKQKKIAIREEKNKAQLAYTQAEGENQTLQKNVARLSKELKEYTAKLEEHREALQTQLTLYGNYNVQEVNIIEQLQKQVTQWEKQEKAKIDLDKKVTEVTKDGKLQATLLEEHTARVAEYKQQLDALKEEQTTKADKRFSLIKVKNLEEEEERLEKNRIQTETKEKELQEQKNKQQQKLERLKGELFQLQTQIENKTKEKDDKEAAFKIKLESQGFVSEDLFVASRMSKEKTQELEAKKETLQTQKIAFQTKKQEKEKELQTEKKKGNTEQTKEEIQTQIEQQKVIKQQRQEEIDKIKYELRHNEEEQGKVKEQQEKITLQDKELQRWKQLHKLIGSEDGRKYRKFAQGITFEILLKQANQQLKSMSDRYLLLPNESGIRDEKKLLDLFVLDKYQAGEVRPTKNLSGGESFIVSLALALGLSKMTSQKAQIDSLFLDEGFGTLDEKSLQIALMSLMHLKKEDKLIGIISHVAAVKESITTQIKVTPDSNGKSKIHGNGVTQQGK